MSRRDTRFPPEVQEAIKVRARGICERCGYGSNAMTCHHRRPKQSGGSRRPDTQLASNGLYLCDFGGCHQFVHANPEESYRHGWLLHSFEIPSQVPVFRRGRWVRLDDDGGLEAVAA